MVRFKRIVLISHEMTYTGAPNSLLNIARILRKHGHQITVYTLTGGPFEQQFRKFGFLVIPIKATQLDKYFYGKFDLVIANTIFCGKIALYLQNRIPTILYIREAQNLPELIKNCKLDEAYIREARNVVCVSEYAAEFIRKVYSPPHLWVLHNFLYTSCFHRVKANRVHRDGKVHFLLAATIEPRKGIDIALSALAVLPAQIKEKAVLHIAGRKPAWSYEYWHNLFPKKDPSVIYHGEVRGAVKKKRLFSKMNVILVPSLDESCSLTALEGAKYGKALIITQNVGAKYIVKTNGFVVKTGSAQALAEAMVFMIDNCRELQNMGLQSFKNFKFMGTQKQYYRQFAEILTKIGG